MSNGKRQHQQDAEDRRQRDRRAALVAGAESLMTGATAAMAELPHRRCPWQPGTPARTGAEAEEPPRTTNPSTRTVSRQAGSPAPRRGGSRRAQRRRRWPRAGRRLPPIPACLCMRHRSRRAPSPRPRLRTTTPFPARSPVLPARCAPVSACCMSASPWATSPSTATTPRPGARSGPRRPARFAGRANASGRASTLIERPVLCCDL